MTMQFVDEAERAQWIYDARAVHWTYDSIQHELYITYDEWLSLAEIRRIFERENERIESARDGDNGLSPQTLSYMTVGYVPKSIAGVGSGWYRCC